MIEIRPATVADASGMGAVHVGVWRSAYAGILPEAYLAGLSAMRQAQYYSAGLLRGRPALVAQTEDDRVVGFATMSLDRQGTFAQSEIETLYVGEDWREQGIGRRLMQQAGRSLADQGARSVFLWVLSANPSQWFYQRLRGRRAAEGSTRVAGVIIPKTAFVWDPIALLTAEVTK